MKWVKRIVVAVLAIDAVAIGLLFRNCDRPDQLLRVDPVAGLGDPVEGNGLAPEDAAVVGRELFGKSRMRARRNGA